MASGGTTIVRKSSRTPGRFCTDNVQAEQVMAITTTMSYYVANTADEIGADL